MGRLGNFVTIFVLLLHTVCEIERLIDRDRDKETRRRGSATTVVTAPSSESVSLHSPNTRGLWYMQHFFDFFLFMCSLSTTSWDHRTVVGGGRVESSVGLPEGLPEGLTEGLSTAAAACRIVTVSLGRRLDGPSSPAS